MHSDNIESIPKMNNNDVILDYAINLLTNGETETAMVTGIINIPEWSKVYKPDAIVMYYVPMELITLKFIKCGYVIEKAISVEVAQDTLIRETDLREAYFKSIDRIYNTISQK